MQRYYDKGYLLPKDVAPGMHASKITYNANKADTAKEEDIQLQITSKTQQL